MILRLTELLQQMHGLFLRLHAQVTAITHAATPDLFILNKECDVFLKEFRVIYMIAMELKAPLEVKIQQMKERGLSQLKGAVSASSLQTVMVLHLVGEQVMGKRLEELNEIEGKRREILKQLEMGVKAMKERFEEMAARLNLLCFMRECLQREGVLPGNVMYNAKIPQVVTSPFDASQLASRIHMAATPSPREPTDSSEEAENKVALLLKLREEHQKRVL